MKLKDRDFYNVIATIMAILAVGCENNTGSTDNSNQSISSINKNKEVDAARISHTTLSIQAHSATQNADEEDYDYGIPTQYAYAPSGKNIKEYRVESTTGVLTYLRGFTTTESISNITVTPDSRLAYATSTNGSSDKIYMFAIDPDNGNLVPFATPTTSDITGSTSIVAGTDNKHVYISNSTQLCTYTIGTEGTLINPSCITTVNGTKYAPYAQIALNPKDKYAYVISGSNKNTILTFAVESSSGKLIESSMIKPLIVANNSVYETSAVE